MSARTLSAGRVVRFHVRREKGGYVSLRPANDNTIAAGSPSEIDPLAEAIARLVVKAAIREAMSSAGNVEAE